MPRRCRRTRWRRLGSRPLRAGRARDGMLAPGLPRGGSSAHGRSERRRARAMTRTAQLTPPPHGTPPMRGYWPRRCTKGRADGAQEGMGSRGWAKGGRDAGRGSKQGRSGSAQHGRRGGDRAGGGGTWRGDRGLGGACQDVQAGQDGGRRAGKGRRGVRAGGRRRARERRRIYLASTACFFTRRRPPRRAIWDKLAKSTKSVNMESTRASLRPSTAALPRRFLAAPNSTAYRHQQSTRDGLQACRGV